MLRVILRMFRRDSRGQDLAEYCLITALIALVGLGIFIYLSGGMQSIWNTASNALVAGSSSSAPAGGSPATSSDHAGH